ncbi:MAG: sigma 54-interacting transcriptional regulator [Thermodesulfobacteriota bacterium]
MSAKNIAKAIERIELIRSTLRWKNQLEKSGITSLLGQLNQLKNELLMLSRQEGYLKSKTGRKEKPRSVSQRRQALLDQDFSFTGVFGENPDLLTLLETVAKAAQTDFPVLIEGESGTGKELIAKVVHTNSKRAEKDYVSVNCGAIPATLLESELFGHVKGAFTGADSTRKGKFELADGGTLFLDELGELSLDNQVKLLRALQTGEIQRVGSDHNITVDVRIVAATNRRLYEMTLEGKFREDLYYRLGVVTVTIPPLRERVDEIPLLIDYFVKEAADKIGRVPVRLSPKLTDFLSHHHYRGNIRELQNIIYRVSCLAEETGGLRHLPDPIRPVEKPSKAPGDTAPKRLEEIRTSAKNLAEERFLEENLRRTQGRVTLMAEELGMNRSYLQNLMKKHGLKAGDFKQA